MRCSGHEREETPVTENEEQSRRRRHFFYFPENIAVAHIMTYPWRTLAVAQGEEVRHG